MLDGDPWGCPMVLNRLMIGMVTKSMDEDALRRVIDDLFPDARPVEEDQTLALLVAENTDWTNECEVTPTELRETAKRVTAKRTAPGPDGVTAGHSASCSG